ncbi:MAG: ATP-binding protein [Kofleriaceae bacterium]|nr:ATP-binding protein [Kofleriaceae bacterium]
MRLILHGKSGRGKTHLAVAIRYRAIQNGFDRRCSSAPQSSSRRYSAASRDNRLADSLALRRARTRSLSTRSAISASAPDAANVLYHVVRHRHQAQRSMIFTVIST